MQTKPLLFALARDRARLFTVPEARDVARRLSGEPPPDELTQALHRLHREGWIVRVKPGLYALDPELWGGPPLHEFELAMKLATPAAISHLSAMQHHSLTDQVPRITYVTVPQTTTPPRLEDRPRPWPMHFRYLRVRPERFFGFTQAWVGETRVTFTDRERTLLDGLLRPRECGGFEEVLHAFEEGLDRLEPDRLFEYARRLEGAVPRRLGWVLEHLGVSADALRSKNGATAPGGYPPLDPTGPRQGPCNARWGLQENLPGHRRKR